MKTTEESGRIKGYDGGKQVKGRKRHLLVDTLGLLLSVYVTPANTSDQEGAPLADRARRCNPSGAHLG